MSRTNFLTICVIIFQHTGRIFIRYYAFYIYIYIYTYIYIHIYIYIYIYMCIYDVMENTVQAGTPAKVSKCDVEQDIE